MPGLNLFTVFINNLRTQEDCMMLSDTASRKFKYRAYHTLSLSGQDVGNLRVDDVVPANSSKGGHTMAVCML